MRMLVFGGDSAAHVMAWKLMHSAGVDELILAPGNGGTSFFAPSVELGYSAVDVASFAVAEALDLVIADGDAIATGIVDEIAALPLPVFGSRQALDQLVRSRCAAREWLQQHALPVPRGRACANAAQAETVAAGLSFPVRVAADAPHGPVVVCADRAAIASAVASCLGSGNEGVIVEEVVAGPVVTASLLTDGVTSVSVPATRLWRQAAQHDVAFDAVQSGSGSVWQRLEAHLEAHIRQPLFAAFQADGRGARGWLGATCVLGPRGALIQSLHLAAHGMELAATLPRLDGDIAPLLLGCARGTLAAADAPRWHDSTVLGVGLIDVRPGGGGRRLGAETIAAFDPGVLVFHHHTETGHGNQYVPIAARGAGRRLSFGGAAAWPTWLGRGFTAGPAAPPALPTYEHDALVGIVMATGAERGATQQRLYDNLRRLNRSDLVYRDNVGARDL